MTDFIAAQADLILPELVGGYAPEYVFELIYLWIRAHQNKSKQQNPIEYKC